MVYERIEQRGDVNGVNFREHFNYIQNELIENWSGPTIPYIVDGNMEIMNEDEVDNGKRIHNQGVDVKKLAALINKYTLMEEIIYLATIECCESYDMQQKKQGELNIEEF